MIVVLFRYPWYSFCKDKDLEFVKFVKHKTKEIPDTKIRRQFKYVVIDARENKAIATKYGIHSFSESMKEICSITIIRREEGYDKFYTLPSKRFAEEYLLGIYHYAVPLVTILGSDLEHYQKWVK